MGMLLHKHINWSVYISPGEWGNPPIGVFQFWDSWVKMNGVYINAKFNEIYEVYCMANLQNLRTRDVLCYWWHSCTTIFHYHSNIVIDYMLTCSIYMPCWIFYLLVWSFVWMYYCNVWVLLSCCHSDECGGCQQYHGDRLQKGYAHSSLRLSVLIAGTKLCCAEWW